VRGGGKDKLPFLWWRQQHPQKEEASNRTWTAPLSNPRRERRGAGSSATLGAFASGRDVRGGGGGKDTPPFSWWRGHPTHTESSNRRPGQPSSAPLNPRREPHGRLRGDTRHARLRSRRARRRRRQKHPPSCALLMWGSAGRLSVVTNLASRSRNQANCTVRPTVNTQLKAPRRRYALRHCPLCGAFPSPRGAPAPLPVPPHIPRARAAPRSHCRVIQEGSSDGGGTWR
jgi:hypothetical protein